MRIPGGRSWTDSGCRAAACSLRHQLCLKNIWIGYVTAHQCWLCEGFWYWALILKQETDIIWKLYCVSIISESSEYSSAITRTPLGCVCRKGLLEQEGSPEAPGVLITSSPHPYSFSQGFASALGPSLTEQPPCHVTREKTTWPQ